MDRNILLRLMSWMRSSFARKLAMRIQISRGKSSIVSMSSIGRPSTAFADEGQDQVVLTTKLRQFQDSYSIPT